MLFTAWPHLGICVLSFSSVYGATRRTMRILNQLVFLPLMYYYIILLILKGGRGSSRSS